MSDKVLHPVFQVLNFIHGSASHPFRLSDAEKLLLVTLASHKGERGIFPSGRTLAKEMRKGYSTIRRLISSLRDKKIIDVQYTLGKSSHFTILILSTEKTNNDQQIPPDPAHARAGGLLTDERGTPLTDERLITKRKRSKERERSLLNFFPDEQSRALALRYGVDLDSEVESFRHRWKGDVSQYEFRRWLNNAQKFAKGVCSPVSRVSEARCTIPEWGPGHPSYDEQRRVSRIMEDQNGMQVPRDNSRSGSG